ncbi:Spc97/Spc98 [Penicillium cf. griseofulvum]|uniref:Spc97/Spc98 n=1 Tax=Penicillium cf. griseofulvum TaxID=2972120 RepID=A0A9W9J1D1_9EURO|nr:Spc97/Spc98 [Penicillium cf. griseofulvum]KAJ5434310.1 Spc97/Spc98 [Penicillium cf. griseofulvum]KAJ5452141.1 Spc97/Spc98 [Penicillium cf. griseofulvum]
MSNPTRNPARGRRLDDALSQLVDGLTPALPISAIQDEDYSDAEEALAAAESRRHHVLMERAWRILDTHASTNAPDPGSPAGLGGRRGSLAGTESINNAPDLIKRKLRRENISPDKAVRFSNLYSRLLTQPVLSQKWGILFLLYKLSASDEPAEGERSRSPLMEEAHLHNMLGKGGRPRRGTMIDSEDEGPAVSSSASQQHQRILPAKMERQSSLRHDIDRGVDQAGRSSTEIPAARVETGVNDLANDEHVRAASPRPSTANPSGPAEFSGSAEHRLLRDLPFNLQGLSSSNLQFSSSSSLKLPSNLSAPITSLLNTLAEPCLLYKGLSVFVESEDGGLVNQSLRAAIAIELRAYLSLVATLEAEIRQALAAIGDGTEAQGVRKGGVTLKRCVVWTRDATMALRLMSLIVEEAQSKSGGQLISLIHGFSTSHGDPFVCAFAEKLLAHVTRPFYDMLRLWIYDGELSDPYKEFFVADPEFRPKTDPRRVATSVWEDKYKLNDDMVPSIITQEFAKKIFLIGKSLNFIRHGCGDSAWVEAYSKKASKELRYGDTATLEISIDEAYKTTMARLISLMNGKFNLFDHLKALKSYLLLGQGDFIALLMESLATNLDRPANSQYRHTLTAQLEHAIRASNAQYDTPEVLRRLDARMLELSHGDIGWDCFTLEYKIDAPVDVVITPWASTQYLKVFNFLWRIKRVEFALNSTWRRCMTGARGVLGNVEDKVGADWKRARCVIAEMIHFVNQLQYYILFEVIESSWEQLLEAIRRPDCTLDDLIEAHTKYLNSITHKGLLGSASSSRYGTSTSTSTKQPEENFLSQLHQILKFMLAYKEVVDGLYSFSVAEFTRRQEINAKIETRSAQGQWGLSERDLLPRQSNTRTGASMASTPDVRPDSAGMDGINTPLSLSGPNLAADDNMLASLRLRLRDISAEFRSRLTVLLGDLSYQPDVDMRFLGVVMNFNDVYELPKRRKAAGPSARDKEKEKEKEREREKAKRRAAASAATGSGTESFVQKEVRRERRDTGANDPGFASGT